MKIIDTMNNIPWYVFYVLCRVMFIVCVDVTLLVYSFLGQLNFQLHFPRNFVNVVKYVLPVGI